MLDVDNDPSGGPDGGVILLRVQEYSSKGPGKPTKGSINCSQNPSHPWNHRSVPRRLLCRLNGEQPHDVT